MFQQKVYNVESRSSFIYKILHVGLNIQNFSLSEFEKRIYLFKRREFVIFVYIHYIPAGNTMLDEE